MAVFDPVADAQPLFDTAEWNDLFSDGGAISSARIDAVGNAVESEIEIRLRAAGVRWPPTDAEALAVLRGIYRLLFKSTAYQIVRGATSPELQAERERVLNLLDGFARRMAVSDTKVAARRRFQLETTAVDYNIDDVLRMP